MQLGRGVKWRAYEDGIVVYVPATCETHVLPPHYAVFFRSCSSPCVETASGINTLAEDSIDVVDALASREFAKELTTLKILDAAA